MKKTFWVFIFLIGLFCLSTRVDAQQPIHTPSDRAATVTKWMDDNLHLVGNQRAQLYQINLKYATKTEELKLSNKSSREKLHIFKENDKLRDAELKAVLDPQQFKAYQAKKSEIIKKFRKEMKPS